MALFSEAEAEACTIVRMENKQKGGSFAGWIIGVEDAEGNYYDWLDDSTAVGVAKGAMKTAISNYLQTNIEKVTSTPVVHSSIEETTKGLGETVG